MKLHQERNDVLREGAAPLHIRKFLQRVGGVTPWGENRYRLVLAQHVMLHCGGRWHDWPENVDITDQGGLEFSEETRREKLTYPDPTNPRKKVTVEIDVPATVKLKSQQPLRVVEEMRWIERYPNEKGWMLQVWFPSSFYSRQHYEVTVTGRPDLPLLGEFPAKGQYERKFCTVVKGVTIETFPKMPGESWMERAIEHHERWVSEQGELEWDDPRRKVRMLTTLEEARTARESYERKQREELEAKIRDRIKPLFGTSLEAGRYREQLAQQAREKGVILGHVGN